MTRNKTLAALEQEQMTSAFDESENVYHDFDTDVMPERTTEEIDGLSIPEGLKTMMKIEAECNRKKKIIVLSPITGKLEIHGKSGMETLLRTLFAMSRLYFDDAEAEDIDMGEIVRSIAIGQKNKATLLYRSSPFCRGFDVTQQAKIL